MRRPIVRTAARWAVVLVGLVILLSAAVGALHLHDRTVADNASGRRAELHREGQRLRDISTLLQGSSLPPADRQTCVTYVKIDERRFGHHYPAVGSADWNYVMSVCAGDDE
jgi:hypothetical protein